MKLNKLIKYSIRFLILQLILTSLTIYYFDNVLISNIDFKQAIYNNLLQDANRFFPNLNSNLISVDAFFGIMVFVFLVILYSTKFYTYVNELSYSINKNYFDEYFQLYLLWTSYLFVVFYVFRFENISRWYLFLFSLLVPILLLVFRNTEFLSSLLGRSVTNENFLSINLDSDSKFRNLRIITFRKDLGNLKIKNFDEAELLIKEIDKVNKLKKINLIVLNIGSSKIIKSKIETFLIDTNKKILIISENQPKFKNIFLYRQEIIDNTYFTYFNNDVQYGSKFILKRLIDIILSIFGIIIFSPIIVILSIYILVLDGSPFYVKQKRVGLHGESFYMYKFRSMKNNSHELRETLDALNNSSGPLFKIENDPRILKGLNIIRRFSLDEILQFFNVIKGEMSIVGPRPLFDDDTQYFDTQYMRRLNVLPGITGLLQINERNTKDFETWYKYDIEYIENWSLYLDLKIILKTPFSMFSKKIQGL
jgi:lipopolysaccharide/colanic/teichoic acid biosynthesis glycosyltransferase